jgi:Ca2+-binding EF-hand superfamily protein
LEELRVALKKEAIDYPTVRRLMDSIDTDHNGKINYTEFLASATGETLLFNDLNIRRAFDMLDRDGNGVVERQELI